MDSLRQVCFALQSGGFGSSVCYWRDNSDTVEDITCSCLRLLDLLRYLDSHSYLSVKLPAMRFASWAVNVVLRAAARIPRLVHFDSHSPEDADRMFAMIGKGLKHNRNLGNVPVRFSFPQGKACLPYLVNQARRNPRVLGWLARDVVSGYIHKSGNRILSFN